MQGEGVYDAMDDHSSAAASDNIHSVVISRGSARVGTRIQVSEQTRRPSIAIDKDYVDDHRRRGFKWVDIQRLLGVSKTKFTNWRSETGYVDPLEHPDDDELDEKVSAFVSEKHTRGEISTQGHLLGAGMYVQRRRVRDSLHRVDPDYVQMRQTHAIPRVQYFVAGPHHVWHVDGNHKLIPYGLVIHGGIDGFSRTVVFLHCSDNNRAETVLSQFLRGTQEYGVPSRVRVDRGTENVDIGTYMNAQRGHGRGSFMKGTSMHNQRIERLWRDTTLTTVAYYQNIFYCLERVHGVNFKNTRVRFLVHYLFLDRINADLQVFRNFWNNHKVSTTVGNYTPNQLLMLHASASDAVPEYVDEEEYGAYYGDEPARYEPDMEEGAVDAGGRVMGGVDEEGVVVPPTTCPLTDEGFAEFVLRVPKLSLTDPEDVFLERLQLAFEVAEDILRRARGGGRVGGNVPG